jgi:hypothetical protein
MSGARSGKRSPFVPSAASAASTGRIISRHTSEVRPAARASLLSGSLAANPFGCGSSVVAR